MPVLAEEFESATVFFSDVSNFAEVSASSTPIATVAFLNSIYTFLDEVIEKFDAYKVPQYTNRCLVYRSMHDVTLQVETIGSVYMVVSGLPSRNKSRHVSEIARMSLDILRFTECFSTATSSSTNQNRATAPKTDAVEETQGEALQLRIGFHSGTTESDNTYIFTANR